jgi:hypothetical protein
MTSDMARPRCWRCTADQNPGPTGRPRHATHFAEQQMRLGRRRVAGEPGAIRGRKSAAEGLLLRAPGASSEPRSTRLRALPVGGKAPVPEMAVHDGLSPFIASHARVWPGDGTLGPGYAVAEGRHHVRCGRRRSLAHCGTCLTDCGWVPKLFNVRAHSVWRVAPTSGSHPAAGIPRPAHWPAGRSLGCSGSRDQSTNPLRCRKRNC